MALETDLNVNPYYDDYDETKNFNRVLFKPAVPLQARELTQLQTILQNQIERFGSWQFKEGSIIKGCNFSFDNLIKYAKINDKDTSNLDVVMSTFSEGDYIRNQSNLVARVADTASGLETQNPGLNTLFFHYLNIGTGGESAYSAGETIDIFPASGSVESVTVANSEIAAFSNSDTITFVTTGGGTGAQANIVTIAAGSDIDHINVTANGTGFTPDDNTSIQVTFANGDAANATVNENFTVNLKKLNTLTIANSSFEQVGNAQFDTVGKAFRMTVNDGVIFQKGHFQRFEDQSIIVTKYTDQPDQVTVGIRTTEAIVNASSDTSLLDNASGFNNENAPGADRLKLTPTLVVNTSQDAIASNNFLSIVEFQGGRPVQLNQKAQLNLLGDELARRTYEESGDYVVDPFSIGTQGISQNTDKIALLIGAGVGYNKGHRLETVSSSRMPLDKATSTNTVTDQTVSMNFGNYVVVDNLTGQMGHNDNDTVVLTDANFNAHTSPNAADPTVNSTAVVYDSSTVNIIGTARVRSIESQNNNNNNHDSQYNLYLYDIKMNSGKNFKNVQGICHYSGTVSGLSETNGSYFGLADVVSSSASLVDSQKNELLFPIGQLGIKDVANSATYTYKKKMNGTFSTSGTDTLNLLNDEKFTFGDGTLSNTQEKGLIIIPTESVNASAALSATADSIAGSNVISGLASTSAVKVGDLYYLHTDGPYQVRSVINSSAFTVDSNLNNHSNVNLKRTFQKGYPISLDDDSSANVVVSGSSTQMAIDINVDLAATLDFDLLVNVKEENANRIVKTVGTTEVAIDVDSNDGGTTGPWNLGVVDAFKLVSVYKGSGADTANSSNFASIASSGTDVTDQFVIDSGQRDAFYGLSKLRRKPGASLTVSAGDQFIVRFRHFLKGTGQGFFSVNSYPVDDANTANTAAVTTQEIPIFVSRRTGKEFSLRDCLDFRPEVANTAVEQANLSSGAATVNPSSTERIDEVSKIPAPDTNFVSDTTFYLPRKDRLVIQNNKFVVVKGTPSAFPQLPPIPDSAMQLATIDVPVYPSLAQPDARYYRRPDLGVIIKATQLKRYTMEDIRSIDQRVTNLEYYSSLNLLEKLTSEKPIPGRTDPTTNRFKNGFIVDNFSSFTAGNPLNTEFKAGFDAARDLLVSRFENYSIPLQFKNGNKITRSNDLVFPRYRNRVIIQQNRATRDRAVTSALWQYNGTVELFPDYLAGVDNVKAPEAAVQIDIDTASSTLALIDELNKAAPQQMTSTEVVSESTTTKVVSSVPSDTQVTNTVEIVKQQQIKQTTTQLSARARTTTKKVGDFVTDLSFQPYIPGTTIRFEATGLRPGMRHYVFFDGENVTEHCSGARKVNGIDSIDVEDRFSSSRRRRLIHRSGAFGDALTSDASGTITGVFRVPANRFFAGEREFVIADVQKSNQLGEDAVSIANARFNCYNFTVRKGDVITSTRAAVPKATVKTTTKTTSSTNYEQVITPLPPAEVTVIENHIEVPVPVDVPVPVPGPDVPVFIPGPEIPVPVPNPIPVEVPGPTIPGPPVFIETPGPVVPLPVPTPVEVVVEVPTPVPVPVPVPSFQDGEGSVAPPPPVLQPVPQTPPLPEPNPRDMMMDADLWGEGEDPLAQTFVIDSGLFGNSGGGYLTAIELYFSSKDRRRGCKIEIRETINGVPGPKVLPFSRVHLPSRRINTSSNGSTGTTFTFRSPVAVQSGKEYCVVILPDGNSPEYKVFTAKAGEKDLRTNITNNQDWGSGTMFLSTNNRTWTEYVDEDAKFRLYSAWFVTQDAQIVLENEDIEFLQSNTTNINGNFTPGEEVFKLAANSAGGVKVTKGNNIITATTTNPIDFTSITGLGAGSRIVLTSNATTYDVVEVDSVSNSSHLVLRGSPKFTNATSNVIFTPCAEFTQMDAATSTIMLNDSSATNSTFLFANNDVLIGCDSNANATINEVVDTNISYLEPRLYRNIPNGAEINTQIKAKRSDTSGDAPYNLMMLNDRYFSPKPIKIMSRSNEIENNSGEKSLNIRHALTSDNWFNAGCIDLQSQELLIYENLINNDRTNEHITDEGSASAKYVSRTIELAEGLDAEDIRVILNAYKPAGTDVHVYAKIMNAEDPDGFEDKNWSLLQRTGINKDKISSTSDRGDVVEYEFEFVDTPDTTVIDGKAIMTNGSATITGSGTDYSNDLSVGDLVKITDTNDQTDYFISVVTEIASATSMTIADAAPFSTIGSVISKVDSTHVSQAFRDPEEEFEVVYYDSNQVKHVGYKYLAIKIVMTATSTFYNPYIQDYRAIAVSL